MFRELKPYPEYAEPRSPWIPAFPSTWSVAPGAGVLQEVRAKNHGLREGTVLSLSYGRVIVKSDNKLHGLVPASFEGYQILEPGDIVIRPTDLQNDQASLRVGAVQNHGIITSAYIGLRPRHIDNWFAFLYLKALDHMKVFYGMGSGLRQNLDFSDFKRLPVPIPTVEEQRAIVTYLAHAHQRINQAIATKRRMVDLLAEERRVVARTVLHSVGGQAVALKHLLRALIDCEHKTAPFWELGSKRIVRTAGVRNGSLVLAGTYPTTDEAYDVWTLRGVPKPGDVIFTREAPAGEACVVPPDLELALGQRTVLMKPCLDRLDPAFLVHQIYAGASRQAIEIASQGSTVGHFNMSDIAALPIPLVDISRQRELVHSIERESARLDLLSETFHRESSLLAEFRTRLTADVVTGQLDVRAAAANLPKVDPEAAFGMPSDGASEDDQESFEGDEQGRPEDVAHE